MSPRAACRLEQLGFTEVYDYVPGKSDWMAAGLPRRGESTDVAYAGDVVTRDVPTCGPGLPLDEVREWMADQQLGFCVVVGKDDLVLGMLHADEARTGAGASTVEQVMRGGPTTVRANEPTEPLLDRMHAAGVDSILVTNPEGRLIGSLDRARTEWATGVTRAGA